VLFRCCTRRLKLEPDHIPLPTLGKEGEKLTFDIKVRLQYTIHNDGSISDVSLLDTNHPEYGETMLKAVASWRYKPCPLDGNPPTAVLVSTFIKTMDLDLDETHRKIPGLSAGSVEGADVSLKE